MSSIAERCQQKDRVTSEGGLETARDERHRESRMLLLLLHFETCISCRIRIVWY